MMVNASNTKNAQVTTTQANPQKAPFNVLDQILSQVPSEIAEAFKEANRAESEETKVQRAMVFTAEFTFPMFKMFEDGNYPEGMPNDVKAVMKDQIQEYNALGSQKEKNIYTLDWLLKSIAFEQSSDPGMEQVLQSIRESYSGEKYSDYKSRDEINDDDYSLKAFKNDLITKGAAKFLYDYNQEKIEEMVDKYRKELEALKEQNPDMELNIEKMLNDYRKELLERLAELEKSRKKGSMNISNLESKKSNSLEELLKVV